MYIADPCQLTPAGDTTIHYVVYILGIPSALLRRQYCYISKVGRVWYSGQCKYTYLALEPCNGQLL